VESKARRRLREEDLAAAPGAHDPLPDAVHADVSPVGSDGLAGGCRSAPAPVRQRGRPGPLPRRQLRRSRARTRRRMRRPACLPRFRRGAKRVAQQTVLCEHFRVLLPELMQQARRALDVREEQCDGPARKLPYVDMIPPRRRVANKPSRLATRAGTSRWCPERRPWSTSGQLARASTEEALPLLLRCKTEPTVARIRRTIRPASARSRTARTIKPMNRRHFIAYAFAGRGSPVRS
jgi:hypothetical protein